MRASRLTRHVRALLILWLLIALYVVTFAVLSVRQNAAFETGAADLGNMNQAAWYTLHHGFPADTFSGEVEPRFRGHVEPIFYVMALPYALHQDADTLLLIQTLVIALGAVAAYMLGRDVLGLERAGLAFAVVYLLFPALEAANLTEFHPVTFAASLFLFAFYYLQRRSYVAFLLFTLLAVSTKEDMALIAIMLGGYAVLDALRNRPASLPADAAAAQRRKGVLVGLVAITAGVIWFGLTVYVIIPQVSASGSVVLFQRYAEVGGSPQGLLGTMLRDPLGVLERLLAPEKLAYLAGLLLSVALLALGAPWALLLAAPSLLINMLSNYPPMYSGLSHYSAPLVPFFIIGGIYGTRWIAGRLAGRWGHPRRSLLVVLTWLLLVASAYHIVVGFTPLALRYRMPVVTAHNRLISRFVQQIPAGATVSAQTSLHPHVSGRSMVYPFPIVNDAEYVLLDVSARPTMHPNDLKNEISRLLEQEGYGVLDAADGYVLLKKDDPDNELPPAFYSAFRAGDAQPQYPLAIDFGPNLRLVGYDLEDIDEGRQPWTRARFYWQVNGALPSDLRVYPYYLDEQGNVVEDTSQRPLVSDLWLPPDQWQPGDVIVTQTLPWPVGDHFRLAVGVARGGDWDNRAARVAPQPVASEMPVIPLDGGTAVEVGRFRRQIWSLRPDAAPAPQPSERLGAQFGADVKLLGYDMQGAVAPGETISLTLYWQATQLPAEDYHTFVHVYDGSGGLAAQSDGITGGTIPASWWSRGQVVTETHTLHIPQTASPTLRQSLAAGLYSLDTGARLPTVTSAGQTGDSVLIPLEP